MASKAKSWLSLALKLVVAVGLIAFMLHSGHLDLHVLLDLLTPFNVAVALTLAGLNIFAAAWRWMVLLKARGFHIPFTYGSALYLIGMFFNYALPGAVSGDLVRAYYLVQDYPEQRMDSVLSVLIDRVLGLYSYFILSLVAILWDFDMVMGHDKIRGLAGVCSLIFIGLTAFFTIAFSARLYQLTHFDRISRRIPKVHELIEGLHRFGKRPGVLAQSIALSLAAQLFALGFFYFLARITHEADVTWSSILFAVPMGFLVTAIPISPAGVGVGQVAFLYLFRTYLHSETHFGATAITAFQISTAVWALLGAVLYVRRRKPHELAKIQLGAS